MSDATPGVGPTKGENLHLARLEERHEALVEKNRAHGVTQAREGHPVQSSEVTALRVEALVEHLLGSGHSVERMEFEVVFQTHLAAALEARGENVMKARLLAGVPPAAAPSKLHIVEDG